MGADYTHPDTLIAASGAPLFLFIASRFDRVLGVGPPEQPAGRQRPSLLDGMNLRAAYPQEAAPRSPVA